MIDPKTAAKILFAAAELAKGAAELIRAYNEKNNKAKKSNKRKKR